MTQEGSCEEMCDGVAKDRVAVIGSGNWGSVAAKLIASNALQLRDFHDEVRMWVFEEILASGEKLSDVINRTNENVKYLPGVKLGRNVVAEPDLERTVEGATMLVFVIPHQFVEEVCKLVGKVRPQVEAISLIKGMEIKKDRCVMVSDLITRLLRINCCVLMGANLASEIAEEKLSEATLGYKEDNKAIADKWVRLFKTPYFLVASVQDVEGIELCGTLKNVVALAAGFVDGLDMGTNTKAAIMRIGLREMRVFSKLMFPSVQDTTFFESCGVADLIVTCWGGRNRKIAEAFARGGGKRSFDELEAELLQGQKLQGVSTAYDVYQVLNHRGWQELFPLFSIVYEICAGLLPPTAIVELCERTPNFSLVQGSANYY